MDDKANVEPAPGQVIAVSALTILCGFGLLLAGLFGGITLIWSWWTQTELPLPLFGPRDTRWNGMSGLLMASSSALFLSFIIAYYFARERLIIACDRLQIVHKTRRGDQVVAQFPYRNIARVFRGDDEGVKYIGILLQNLADPDTFFPGSDFPTNDAAYGWHYKIADGYQRGLDEILEMIHEHLRIQKNA